MRKLSRSNCLFENKIPEIKLYKFQLYLYLDLDVKSEQNSQQNCKSKSEERANVEIKFCSWIYFSTYTRSRR